jgi:hypothetical protein
MGAVGMEKGSCKPDDRRAQGGTRLGSDRSHPGNRMGHSAAYGTTGRNDMLVEWSGCRAKRNDDTVGGSR